MHLLLHDRAHDIITYNKCTNTQGPDFNQAPFPDRLRRACRSSSRSRSSRTATCWSPTRTPSSRLDSTGNVIETYPCSSLPGCGQGQLFGLAVDPSGTSFWTGDEFSGHIWQVNIATGTVMQTINTTRPDLFGLSVDNELTAAVAPTPWPQISTALVINPASGNFSSPTPVSAVLTARDRHDGRHATTAPIPDEPVTFTLNGLETCTATTDSTGTATCVITPGEPSRATP